MNAQDVILGILTSESKSGYDIKKMFEELFSYFFDASFGTIYPTLAKMEKEGLITKESVAQQGKPNKHIYTITAKGKEQFQTYLHSGMQDDVIRSDFMVRLFFGELADQHTVQGWLNHELEHKEKLLERLQGDYKRFLPSMSPTQDICAQLGIANMGSSIKILKEGIAKLQSIHKEDKG
jgi:DNA-binding PadR family transcriptional regulator